MPYLHRRVKYLLDQLKSGTLILGERSLGDRTEEALRDLRQVRVDQMGQADLSTCTPLIRALARSLYSLRGLQPEKGAAAPPEPEPVCDPVPVQRELFAILEEFFERATGSPPSRFATPDTFSKKVRLHAQRLVRRYPKALAWASKQLDQFYREHQLLGSHASRYLGGMKLVLASQRFSPRALQATRSMILYADTIFIPDPVLPWLERERREERFRDVHLLQAAFHMLQLKPLVDADLPCPPVIVFPSWEKTLERADEATQDEFGRFILDFFSFSFRTRFEDESEILSYARSNPGKALRTVEQENLFVAPGGSGREEIAESIRLYQEMIAEQRSKEYQAMISNWSDAELVVNGIMERLGPQFHLRDNSDWLGAHPMMWSSPQWHYYSMCTRMGEGQLTDASLLRPETVGMLHALTRSRFEWLGNVPLEDLIELRRENANQDFRRSLRHCTEELRGAALEDVDRVAAETARGVASLLAENRKAVRRIHEEFRKRHARTLTIASVALVGSICPWLAPYMGSVAAPLVVAGKYVGDKVDERSKRREVSRSLTGVLAAAHPKKT